MYTLDGGVEMLAASIEGGSLLWLQLVQSLGLFGLGPRFGSVETGRLKPD